MTHTVTAAVVTYNRRDLVVRAIQTILDQTRPVDEIVVVDDGSTDGTAELVESRFGDKVRLVRQANAGVSGARRRALAEARCDWIAFLDSDDEWLPRHNEVLLKAAAEAPPDVAWIFGDTLIVHEGEESSLLATSGLEVGESLKVFDDPMPTQWPYMYSILETSLVRTEVLRRTGAFEEGLRSSEDLLAAWTIAAEYPFGVVAEPLTRAYRTSELVATSLDFAGKASPDYFRARVIGLDRLARSTRPGPWPKLHASAVRGLCLRLAASGARWSYPLAFQQVRHHRDIRTLAFFGFSLFGRAGMKAWTAATEKRVRSPAIDDPLAFKSP